VEHTIALVLTAGAGALAWLLAILIVLQRVRLKTKGLAGTGTLVEARRAANQSADYTPTAARAVSLVVEVVDASTGQPFQFRSWFSSSVTKVTLGEQVPVRYMAGDPEMAEIDRLAPMWGPPAMAALYGTVMLGVWWYLRGVT